MWAPYFNGVSFTPVSAHRAALARPPTNGQCCGPDAASHSMAPHSEAQSVTLGDLARARKLMGLLL